MPLEATVDVTPSSIDSWQQVDVSAYVPEGTTGAILHYSANGTWDCYQFGFRKTGSTDNRTQIALYKDHLWAMIGVDSNRTFECYLGKLPQSGVYLTGYTMQGVTFFTNAIEKNPGQDNGWVDINTISVCPNAIGVILEYTRDLGYSIAFSFGVRKNGSTDDRIGENPAHAPSGHCWAIVGVDENGIFEGNFPGNYTPNPERRFYIVGYVTSGATFKTNEDDISLSTVSEDYTDIDLSDEAPGSSIVFIEIEVDIPETYKSYALRKKGETGDDKDNFGYCARHDFAFVAVDINQILEGKIESTYIDFYLIGYAW